LASADPSGFETALVSADLLATNVPEKAADCRETTLGIRRRRYERSRGRPHQEAGEAYVEALLEAAAAQAQAGDLDEALRHCRQARTIARAVRSEKAGQAEAELKCLAALKRSADRAESLKKQLAADPSNRKARDDLVYLLLVDLDRPAEAATFLDEGCDATFRKFIPGAAKPVDEAPELACMELGDWYRGLAEAAAPAAKAPMFVRAKAYYDRFLRLHEAPDLDRKRVALVAEQVAEALDGLGWKPRATGRWINLVKLADVGTHEGQWKRTDAGLVPPDANFYRRIVLPMKPQGDYDVEFRFTFAIKGARWTGVFLPVGQSGAWYSCWADFSWLNNIDGVEMNNKSKAPHRASLYNGLPHTVRIRVMSRGDKAVVASTLDGFPVMKWVGLASALPPPNHYGIPPGRSLGVAAETGGATFHTARLRMLSGKAVPLRKP